MNIEILREHGLPEMTFDAGTVLIQEGAEQKNVYVLISGQVDVRSQGQQLAVVDAPGTVLGEVALLLGQKPVATIATLENSSFYVIGDFMEFIRENPNACVNVAQTLASHLIKTVNHLVYIKDQLRTLQDTLADYVPSFPEHTQS
jgi:CRP-like cAMP-binding protein